MTVLLTERARAELIAPGRNRFRVSPAPGEPRMQHKDVSLRAVELLRTPRILLRRWQMDDLPAYFDIYSRDEVTRWIGPHPRRALTDLHAAGERLRRWHEREANLALPYGLWALVPCIESDQPQPPVGTVLLLPLVDAVGFTEEVEIGWHLHPNWQGRGLVTEAAAAVLGRASAVGRERVLALTDIDNSASQSVAMRLGMTDEGVTDRWFGLTKRQFVWRPMSRRAARPAAERGHAPLGRA